MGDCSQEKLHNIRPAAGSGLPSPGGRRFVIQKHAARRLHYDLRLEIGGGLVSWAMPKGLSTTPTVKRLAIQTENNPMPYADFEGMIPQGKYGAATGMLWDMGRYRNLRAVPRKGKRRRSMADSLRQGWLEGKKLHGGYALKRLAKEGKPQWLAVKMKDSKADARRDPLSIAFDSVLTGRSLREIARQSHDDCG